VGCGLALLLAGVSLASYSYKGTKSFGKNADTKSSLVQASQPSQAKINESVGKLPLAFEPNQGQVDPQVKFLARAKGYTALLTENEAVLAIKGSAQGVLRMKMQNASPATRLEASDRQVGKSNYLRPSGNITNVPNYGKVTYKGIYPGIDVAYYGSQRTLEYDFVVSPGADPKQIRIAYEGSSRFALNAAGDLELETAAGRTFARKPVSYQTIHGARNAVQSEYVLTARNEVGIKLGSYDHSQAVVIDPVLQVLAFLGGSLNDEGFAIAANSTGVYLTGRTGSLNYPVLSGAAQATHYPTAGNFDVFVTKLDQTGTTLLYSTYLGAAGDDAGQGIAVDSSGNAYVGGYTNLSLTASPAPVVAFSGIYAAFIAKLAPGGASVSALTYFGGNGTTQAFSLAMDPAQTFVVIGGLTTPLGATPTGAQKTFNNGAFVGSDDGFIATFKTADLTFNASTYIGGGAADQINSVAVGTDGTGATSIYAAGFSTSGSISTATGGFPTKAAVAIAGTIPSGTQAAIVAKYNSSLSSQTYASIFGVGGESGNGVAVDPTGVAYVVGATKSISFVITGAANPGGGVAPGQNGSLGSVLSSGAQITGAAPVLGVSQEPSPRGSQGFLVALTSAGALKYVSLQPEAALRDGANTATCNLNISRIGGAFPNNPCTGVYSGWNAVTTDTDLQAYAAGQRSAAPANLAADVVRYNASGSLNTPVTLTNGAASLNQNLAITVNGNREAFFDGITTSAAPGALVSSIGGPVGPPSPGAAGNPAAGTPIGTGLLAPNGTPPPALAVADSTNSTPETKLNNGGEDVLYGAIQYLDILATPPTVTLPTVSVGSPTLAGGPTAVVQLLNFQGIAQACTGGTLNGSAVVGPVTAGGFTVTQVPSTNTWTVQYAVGSTASPATLGPQTFVFACPTADNLSTITVTGAVTGPINLAPAATLFGTEVFNTGILAPWNTLGFGGTALGIDAAIPVAVTTPIGSLTYTTSIPNASKSANYPTCALFYVSGPSGNALAPGVLPLSTFNVGVSSTCAATLNPGTYTASVSVASTSASNSPQTLPLSLIVTAGTILTQTVGPLTFGPSQNAQQTAFSINANNGTINYGINYISGGIFSPNGFALPGGNVQILTGLSGTILGGGSQSVVVQVTPVGLAKGVYSGTFQVVQVNPVTAALNNIQNVVLTVYVGTGLGVIRPAGAAGVLVSVPTGFTAAQLAQPFAALSLTGTTTLAAINAVPPTIAITGLDNTWNTPYTITAPTIAWTGTAPPANPVTGASSEVTIAPPGNCATFAPSAQFAGIAGVPCAYNITVDTVGITTPTTFTGTITFAATATGGGSISVPIQVQVTGTPQLLSTNCPGEQNVGLVTSGPACIAPSPTTPASPVVFNAQSGTVPQGGFNFCQYVDVFATGGVVPTVSATLPASAPWASFDIFATLHALPLGSITTTGVLNPPVQATPIAGRGFPICVNQSLVPLGAGTVSTNITIQGSGVGIITIPVTFITSSNNPGSQNFRQIGTFRNSLAGIGAGFVLDSNGNNNYDASDKARFFGLPGDIPVAGDFFGNGIIEIGVFRCPTGATVCQWFIDANNSGAWDGPFGGDQIWNFGLPGDIPVVGDWNGNGTSKIGIFRCPAAGSTTPCTWVLDAGNMHVYDPATAVVASYGLAGDMPVVNNWNGGGTVDQIGVFRGNGLWIVDSNGSNTWEVSDAQYTYGLTGDKPVVGNWNGTGKKRIGVFRPSAGIWVLNLSGSNAWLPIDAVGFFGTTGDLPVVGLWTLP
jgi:hypothetical protein